MYRVLVAPEFEIQKSDPDFPPSIFEALKNARSETQCNYISVWVELDADEFSSHVIVTTYPTQWVQEYTFFNYSRIDPSIVNGLNSTGAVIFDHENPGKAELEALAEGALRNGIGRFTVGIPANFGSNIRSVTTFATDKDMSVPCDDNQSAIAKYREQAYIIGLAVVERFLKNGEPKVNLTERETEVLYWGSLGKTDQQTGEIMGISRWTVVAHTQSAKSKLRVNNKAAAISRAHELHLFNKFNQKL